MSKNADYNLKEPIHAVLSGLSRTQERHFLFQAVGTRIRDWSSLLGAGSRQTKVSHPGAPAKTKRHHLLTVWPTWCLPHFHPTYWCQRPHILDLGGFFFITSLISWALSHLVSPSPYTQDNQHTHIMSSPTSGTIVLTHMVSLAPHSWHTCIVLWYLLCFC